MIRRFILVAICSFLLYRAALHGPVETMIGLGCGLVIAWAIMTLRTPAEENIIKLAGDVARAWMFEKEPVGEAVQKLSRAVAAGGYDVKR